LNDPLGETYHKLIQALQQREKRTGSQPTLVRDLKTEPGKGKGLLVVLDSHSDVLSASSLDSETIGFVGLITQGGNFPQKKLGGFDIRPGARVIKKIWDVIYGTLQFCNKNVIFFCKYGHLFLVT
jgi:hypothetical protein